MKVSFLIDSLGFGGAQKQIIGLAGLFKDAGYEVTFFTYRRNDFYQELLGSLGICEIFIPNSNFLNRMFKVRKAIRKNNPDIVISFLETPNFLACFSSIGHHKWKLITNERSAKINSFRGFRNRLYKIMERHSNAIVCNSNYAAGIWKKMCPQFKNKIHVIYNALFEIPFSTNYAECDTDSELCSVVVAASYQDIKNPKLLLEAISSLEQRYKERILVEWFGRIEPTKGDTHVFDECQQIIADSNLGEFVKFYGETKDIQLKFKKASFVALFSKVEGFPNSILEGMALEKPIIMSKVSDYSVLVDDSNGFLCDPYDANDIKKCLKSAVDTSVKERKLMGHNSKKKALELCSKEKIFLLWEQLIESIA